MGYIQFPQIIEPHAFKTFTATLKKVCAKVTHTPETTEDCKLKNMQGAPDPRSNLPRKVSQAKLH